MAFESRLAATLIIGALALVTGPSLAQRAPTSGPIARYDMRAGTVSGFMAMGRGLGGAMGMATGGGGDRVQKELYLRLGSSQGPAKGAPKADHFMPAGAKLGKSVTLVTPKQERPGGDEMPQKPTGRLLLYWGCGEHAGKGQPVVFDFAKMAQGQIPPGLWTSTILRDWGPTMQNSATFGRWPAEDGKMIKPESSLLGEHKVVGNYSPEISFTLGQDFLDPLRSTQAVNASGSATLSWNSVPRATGYLAWMFGGKMAPGGQMGDMVMWTSSAGRQFGGGLTDWLSPAQVAALVKDRTVMAPATTSCTIPVEVRNTGPDFRMGMLTAFGPEEDFAYPARPADAKAPWHLQWTARVRHRSITSWMDMPGMTAAPDQQPPNRCKKKRGLGGIIGGVVGANGC